MWKRLTIKFLMGCISLLLLTQLTWGSQLEETLYQDKTNIVSEQIKLLKNRTIQAQRQLLELQHKQDNHSTLSIDHVNKPLLSQAELEIAVAKSNIDSITIEVSESQQTISRLENDIQEIENQLNVFNMFGLKVLFRPLTENDRISVIKFDRFFGLLVDEDWQVSYFCSLR